MDDKPKLCKDCNWCKMYRHEVTCGVETRILLLPGEWTCHAPQFIKSLGLEGQEIDLLTGVREYGPGASCARNRNEDREGYCCGCMVEGHWFEAKEPEPAISCDNCERELANGDKCDSTDGMTCSHWMLAGETRRNF